jgi:hypothetical protein
LWLELRRLLAFLHRVGVGVGVGVGEGDSEAGCCRAAAAEAGRVNRESGGDKRVRHGAG